MSKSDKPGEGRGIFSFLRRGADEAPLSEFHSGDIRSDETVTVAEGSTVAGNVFAPQVVVAGTLFGSVLAREVNVASSGQLWGDVYALRIQVESGGHIQGRTSDIDETAYQGHTAKGSFPEMAWSPDLSLLPPEIQANDRSSGQQGEEFERGRRLRARLASALNTQANPESRSEVEADDDAGERLIVGDDVDRELAAIQTEMMNLERENADMAAELGALKKQLERQTGGLQGSQEEMSERERELEQLRELSAQQELEIKQLREARGDIELRMHARRQEVDELHDRIESLEAALQATIRSETEREQSLMRWQELANSGEERVEALQQELASVRKALNIDPNEVVLLRRRNQQLAEELQAALNALQQQEAAMATMREQFAQTEEDWQLALAELQARDAEMSTLQEQFNLLKENWREATQSADVFQEEFLWQKADRESVQSVLEQFKQGADDKEKRLRWLQADLDKVEEARSKDRALIERLTSELAMVEEKSRKQQEDLTGLQTMLAKRGVQLQEAERTAAEQIAQLRSQIQEQLQLIDQLKKATSERIQELEGQIAQVEKEV